ncbi:hypothetical protein PVL29_016014 [Vitis rotundifolia]|uniref:Basic blue protein n=2 Tax=Vitis rotundifolia TaxID=103349 RepID=A0AA39DKY6_VITRO|nr:hypothetical protein PVL29_016014 [Vitis rotundifolia]
MAMARGIAAAIPTATALLLWVVLHLRTAHAATYTVGDSSGWTFNVESWTDGKSFRAGDVLVFNYDPKDHNVVAVDQYSYDTCTVGEGAKVYESGNDSIELVKGENCFICSFLSHCDSGMKIHMIAH